MTESDLQKLWDNARRQSRSPVMGFQDSRAFMSANKIREQLQLEKERLRFRSPLRGARFEEPIMNESDLPEHCLNTRRQSRSPMSNIRFPDSTRRSARSAGKNRQQESPVRETRHENMWNTRDTHDHMDHERGQVHLLHLHTKGRRYDDTMSERDLSDHKYQTGFPSNSIGDIGPSGPEAKKHKPADSFSTRNSAWSRLSSSAKEEANKSLNCTLPYHKLEEYLADRLSPYSDGLHLSGVFSPHSDDLWLSKSSQAANAMTRLLKLANKSEEELELIYKSQGLDALEAVLRSALRLDLPGQSKAITDQGILVIQIIVKYFTDEYDNSSNMVSKNRHWSHFYVEESSRQAQGPGSYSVVQGSSSQDQRLSIPSEVPQLENHWQNYEGPITFHQTLPSCQKQPRIQEIVSKSKKKAASKHTGKEHDSRSTKICPPKPPGKEVVTRHLSLIHI